MAYFHWSFRACSALALTCRLNFDVTGKAAVFQHAIDSEKRHYGIAPTGFYIAFLIGTK